MNIDKDGGDIAFITYEKGEAEAKVIFQCNGYFASVILAFFLFVRMIELLVLIFLVLVLLGYGLLGKIPLGPSLFGLKSFWSHSSCFHFRCA